MAGDGEQCLWGLRNRWWPVEDVFKLSFSIFYFQIIVLSLAWMLGVNLAWWATLGITGARMMARTEVK